MGSVARAVGLSFLLGVLGACGQREHRGEPDAPQTVVEDLGVIHDPASEIRHRFLIRNDSGAEWHLRGVFASCGCLDAKASEAHVPGGTSLRVDVALDTRGRAGPQRITATCLFERRPLLVLVLSCDLQSNLRAVPPALEWGEVLLGETISRRIRLDHPAADEIARLTPLAPSLEAAGREFEGGSWLVVSLTPSAPGPFVGPAIGITMRSGASLSLDMCGTCTLPVVAAPPEPLVRRASGEPGIAYFALRAVESRAGPFAVVATDCADGLDIRRIAESDHPWGTVFRASLNEDVAESHCRLDVRSPAAPETPIVVRVTVRSLDQGTP